MARRKHMTTAFSYSIDDEYVIDEIDKIAKDSDVSFSYMVMQELKALVHTRSSEAAVTTRTRISIFSHVIDGGENRREDSHIAAAPSTAKELNSEDKQTFVIRNLVKATKDALPTISHMDVDEFAREIKTPIIDSIYKHRHSKYRKEQHTKSLVPLQLELGRREEEGG